MRLLILASMLVLCVASVGAASESAQTLIQRALSAAPPWLRSGATVVTIDSHGKQTMLRLGNNGFTCLPGTPGVIGDDPMCMDAQAQVWVKSLIAHKARPANTAPGIIYMQAGGTDLSAHWQDSGTWIMFPGTPYAHAMIIQKF